MSNQETDPKAKPSKGALSMSLNINQILPVLKKLEPYLFGAALVALFGYTALVVNGALNVQPVEVSQAVDPKSAASSKITFDKATIEAVKKLSVVQGDVPVGDLGTDDPFR